MLLHRVPHRTTGGPTVTTTPETLLDVSDLDDEFGRPAPVQPRDGRDRPLIVPPGGGQPVAYQRASTFANVLTDQSGLTTWKVRHAVRGVASNPALVARAVAAQYGEKDLDEVIEAGLLLDGASDAAGFGTAFHRLTEPDARDRADEAPESIRADVRSYWQALDAAGLRIVATEEFVVHDGYRVAGTFDHIIELPDGLGRVVADKKTGSYKPREHAVQLAVYAGGVRYDHEGEFDAVGLLHGEKDLGQAIGKVRRSPLNVRQDLALLIHTPHGKGETILRWIRLDRGREAIERALWLREWRSASDVDLAFEDGLAVLATLPDEAPAAPEPPAPETPPVGEHEPTGAGTLTHDELLDAVANAPTTDAIAALYAANRDAWNAEVRELARARRALVEAAVV